MNDTHTKAPEPGDLFCFAEALRPIMREGGIYVIARVEPLTPSSTSSWALWFQGHPFRPELPDAFYSHGMNLCYLVRKPETDKEKSMLPEAPPKQAEYSYAFWKLECAWLRLLGAIDKALGIRQIMRKIALRKSAQKRTIPMHQGWAELQAKRAARPRLGLWILAVGLAFAVAFWRP
jgi:hypothetical protein